MLKLSGRAAFSCSGDDDDDDDDGDSSSNSLLSAEGICEIQLNVSCEVSDMRCHLKVGNVYM